MTFHVGDQVYYQDDVYEITRKRMGSDMYEIAKPHSHYGQRYLTNVIDGIRSDELIAVEVIYER